jgi:NTP pyrophosphatase (non-canonical NTP hydrolase)
MNIKNLIKECHEIAVSKGFYDCPECKGEGHFGRETTKYPFPSMDEIECGSCNGTGKDPTKNIGEMLMLIVSELSEALEAHRKGKFCRKEYIDLYLNKTLGDIEYYYRYFEHNIKDTFEDEIADVFIRLFDLCGYLEIEHIEKISQLLFKLSDNVGNNLFILTREIAFLYGIESDSIETKNYSFSSYYTKLVKFCKHHNIDIEKHIKAKMEYNKRKQS